MKRRGILIFGYNEYGLEIAKNVINTYDDITIFSVDEISDVRKDNYRVKKFDLSDNWDDLEHEYDIANSMAFCALNDEAQNIFLTISLRSSFENLQIIALASNNEDANKIHMAGASKVIPLVETTAGMITDMIEKPIMSKVLHEILYEESDLKIVQIKVNDHMPFDGKHPLEIDWGQKYGIIVLSIIHEDMSSDFIYSSKSKHHRIVAGDTLITVGYDSDLKKFKKLLGDKS